MLGYSRQNYINARTKMKRFYDFTLALQFNNRDLVLLHLHYLRATYIGIGKIEFTLEVEEKILNFYHYLIHSMVFTVMFTKEKH